MVPSSVIFRLLKEIFIKTKLLRIQQCPIGVCTSYNEQITLRLLYFCKHSFKNIGWLVQYDQFKFREVAVKIRNL